MAKKHEYQIGYVYGCKKLLDFIYKNNIKMAVVECVHCGKQSIVRPNSLFSDRTTSCMCMNTKHGDNGSRLYGIWGNMKYRCNNQNAQGYRNYGGKGISVCNEWDNYIGFRDWALSHGYSDNLTIDRIDPSLNYCPENCRWVTLSENVASSNKTSQHRRANRGTYFGVSPDGNKYEFENAGLFAKEHNLSPGCVRQCANGYKKTHHGWTFGFI